MIQLKPCPFCGCDMIIRTGEYPNGDPLIEPFGLHNTDCILRHASMHTYPEDGWTAEKIAKAWNDRKGGDEHV